MIANQTLISRMNIWHIPDRIAFSEKPRKKRSIGKCNPTEVTHKINKRTCKVCDLSSPLMYHDGIGCVRSVKDCPTASRLRLVPLPHWCLCLSPVVCVLIELSISKFSDSHLSGKRTSMIRKASMSPAIYA